MEARTRLKDIALARSFNFDNWRKRFNGWVDQQKLRVNDLFRRFDGNHDGMLTREEFMKALRASGETKIAFPCMRGVSTPLSLSRSLSLSLSLSRMHSYRLSYV